MNRPALVAIAATLTASICVAQDITGVWVGKLRVAERRAQWVVTLSKDRQGELNGNIWLAQSLSTPSALTAISWNGSRLGFSFQLPIGKVFPGGLAGAVSFTGALSEDVKRIDGWIGNTPLKLERVKNANAAKGRQQKSDMSVAASTGPTPPVSSPASATLLGNTAESSEILSRALAKLAGTSQRLLKYACLETIERTYYNQPSQKLGAYPMGEPSKSCDGMEFSKDGRLRLDAEDRMRLQVAVSEGKEIYSWAAASRFDSRSVFEMIPAGPMSTGPFGTALVDIFENPGTRYKFTGRRSDGPGDTFEYEFEVPIDASHSRVRAGNEWITTAYYGSFDIDSSTAGLVRLIAQADPLPPETAMCRNRTATEYRYISIGDGRFLVPLRSEFDVLRTDGGETRSVSTFADCREYAAESNLLFDDEGPATTATALPKAAAPLPPGVSLTLALLNPIDTNTAAAGDAVAAKVVKAVRAPGSNEALVDAGAIVHGRITQVRHQFGSPQFQIAISYETLEQRGEVALLTIELDRELKAEQARTRNGFATHGSEFSLPALSASGESGSWFAFPAISGHHVMPAGFESKWITVTK
jgi:hypothetical protein